MATSFIYSLFVIVPILTVFLDKPFTEPTKKAISLPETTAPKTDIAHSHVLFFFPAHFKKRNNCRCYGWEACLHLGSRKISFANDKRSGEP